MSVTALYDVPAPAKLNLFLHVVGRRPDGYHLLQSVFRLIDWCDTLHFERRAAVDGSRGGLSRRDLGPALPENDLSLRAARLLQEASGTHWGAHIELDKRVPWGAGLGGGSSDAASTLLALNRLWELNWPREKLLPLAASLGADVPFFVQGQDAWVEGIGEVITPLELPQANYVVVKPNIEIPTVAIFSSNLLTRSTPQTTVAVFAAETNKFFGTNDLQPCAQAYSELVTQALDLLEHQVGESRMSGSGSSVFARVETSTQAEQVLATLPSAWTGRWCRSLGVHPLRDWATG